MKKLLLFALVVALLTFHFKAFGLEIYAHRGGRGIVPENTMPAYRASLALGVDFVDMDILMTKDGVIMATHNFSLNPDITRDKNGKYITNKNILIKSLTLDELKKYDVGKIKPKTKYAKLFSDQYSIPHTRIPTLREVIHYVKKNAGKKVSFQIEIKTAPGKPNWSYSPEKLATELAKILKEEGIVNRTEVQAFDFRCLLALQKNKSKD